MKSASSIIKLFISDLDAMFYGPNNWQAGYWVLVKNLTARQAGWTPFKNRPCIRDYVRHSIYWKYSALMSSQKKSASKEPLHGYEHDWQLLYDSLKPEDWKRQLKDLKKIHEDFKEAVIKSDASLFKEGNMIGASIRGIIYHDAYHAGQIGLLRALQGIEQVV